MLKTYAPKGLHGADLRGLLDDLQATPADAAKFLQVTERSVWRWLADGSAPFAALATLWHESPRGRETAAVDVGNALVAHRGLARAHQDAHARETQRLARLVQIGDFGAANDPLIEGPFSRLPVRDVPGFAGRNDTPVPAGNWMLQDAG
ncbi:MAG: hypothetical protein EAZ11_12250 [Curvibacter sp.]|nr:MAG: hypothetical protein EAZ11_12250 [Curvibacter sp.]